MLKRTLQLLTLVATTFSSLLAFANTPGAHSVSLTWTAPANGCGSGCSYNLYRSPTPNVCAGTPTPYTTAIPTTSYVDLVGLTDGQTLYYNVSAVGSGGGEGPCNGELQVQIPVLPSKATAFQATAK